MMFMTYQSLKYAYVACSVIGVVATPLLVLMLRPAYALLRLLAALAWRGAARCRLPAWLPGLGWAGVNDLPGHFGRPATPRHAPLLLGLARL